MQRDYIFLKGSIMFNRKIYKQIAKKHGVSVEQVKRDMRLAIEQAYKNQELSENTKMLQNEIPRKGETPTPDELITFISKKISKDL